MVLVDIVSWVRHVFFYPKRGTFKVFLYNHFVLITVDDRRGPSGDPRDQPRDPRGPPPDQRFGAGGPRDPRAERGPPGPPSDGRFSGPSHSPQQQWAPNQGGPPPRGPSGEISDLKECKMYM